MSDGASSGRPSAEILRCVGCAAPFGSMVAFCPFCGAAQRPAVVHATPHPPVAPSPARPQTAVPSVPQAGPVSPPIPPRPKSLAQGARPVRTRSRWVFWVAALCAVAIGAEIVVLRNAGPVASLLVRVRTPAGAPVPEGQVVVNDRAAGAPGEPISVAAGSSMVTFAKPGWRADSRMVSLAANASVTIDLTARELPGHLSLTTTPPGAAVSAGARGYGRSPVSVDLAPGPYEFAVVLNGYVTKLVSVVIVHGETATLTADMTPLPPRRTEAPFDHGVTTRAVPLLATPAAGADALAMVPAGMEVRVQARVVADTAWLQIKFGTRTGFVPPESVEAWEVWAQRNTVAGAIDLVTPDLRVGIAGGLYPLSGVQPPPQGGAELARMSSALQGLLRGVPVRCTPQTTGSFVCRTGEGGDVAERYLFNGCAVVADGATPHYAELEHAAQEQQRGVWAQ